jgi:hypothetical protein
MAAWFGAGHLVASIFLDERAFAFAIDRWLTQIDTNSGATAIAKFTVKTSSTWRRVRTGLRERK